MLFIKTFIKDSFKLNFIKLKYYYFIYKKIKLYKNKIYIFYSINLFYILFKLFIKVNNILFFYKI